MMNDESIKSLTLHGFPHTQYPMDPTTLEKVMCSTLFVGARRVQTLSEGHVDPLLGV